MKTRKIIKRDMIREREEANETENMTKRATRGESEGF